MRPASLLLAVVGFCVTAAGGAHASDVEGVRAKFREIDTNGDRAMQFSEIEAARAKIFGRMDANGNGVLDQAEIDTVRKVAAAQGKKSGNPGFLAAFDASGRMTLMDTNGDGAISRAEFAGFIPPEMRRADSNGDNALSIKEMRSLKRARDAAQAQ